MVMMSDPLVPEHLLGQFHAHITVRAKTDDEVVPPHGWKTTIIVLSKDGREQKDVMITRHFKTGTEKTPGLDSIVAEISDAAFYLAWQGFEAHRAKLEHESLPTLAPSATNYREAHIKIQVPRTVLLQTIPGYVKSRNPMSETVGAQVVFLNARYYEGTMEEVDAAVDEAVVKIQALNPHCKILELKKETTVFDNNHDLDKWWA